MSAELSSASGPFAAPLPTPPSRTEQVYAAIVDGICTGQLAPGTPLRQEQLAERLQVSRQPVQQALLLLRNQGLLREHGRRGLVVAPVDADFVRDVYELRALLDGHAARLAAARRTGHWLDEAARIVAAGQRARDERAFADMITADVSFHRAVVAACGNPLFTESAAVLWRNVQRTMSEVLLQGGSPAWVWDDHEAILAAIRDGDSGRAEALARHHAEHGEQLILDGLPEPAA